MEPVGAVAHEVGRIVAPGAHMGAEDPAEVPFAQHLAAAVDFGDGGLDPGDAVLEGVEFGQHPGLAGRQVMVEIDHCAPAGEDPSVAVLKTPSTSIRYRSGLLWLPM